MKNNHGNTVIAAMSGGVDSSVAAALLVEQGHRVIGVTMKLFCLSSYDGLKIENSCCSLDSVKAAVSVADKLGIPHTVLDMEDVFREEVLKNFFSEYSAGRTPNPCILCNSRVKFDHLFEKGRQIGANFLATGHYALTGTTGTGEEILHTLARAKDPDKDQSYFLWEMDQDVLSRTLFPLGNLNKPSVREKARELGLEVADRPESQDFCFLSPQEIRKTARKISSLYELGLDPAATRPGPVVDVTGERIGTHDGIAYYTTGQRRHLGIALGRPAYVLSIDPKTNTLVVGFEEDSFTERFNVSSVNWVSGRLPDTPQCFSVKVRSRSSPIRATVTPTSTDTASVELHEPKKAVTPGQSAVWYDGQLLVGGGVVDRPVD